jgi:hypothetical protein
MNRRITTFSLLLVSAALFFAQDSNAQIHVGAAFGTDTEIGVQASYYMPLSVGDVEGLSVGGDFMFYLPQKDEFPGGDVTTTYFEINANGHYNLVEVAENGMLYGIGGLQYARASVSADANTGFGNFSYGGSSSDVGLNVGAGVGISRFFVEAKFSLGGFEQLALSGGVTF